MERATQVTILVFGVLNLLFAAVGLYMSVETFAHPGHLSDSQTSPFLVEAFYGMSALNLAFVLALARAALRGLPVKNRDGLRRLLRD